MRLILTGLAAAIVLALIAALVGPHFVDWSAHRGAIEARLSQALGAPVRLEAPIEVRLLPSPRLSARGVAVGAGEGGAPRVTTGAAQFELSAPSLTRGEWRFVEARLDKPIVTLALDAAGRIVGSTGASVAATVEALQVVDGALVVNGPDGAERLRLAPINLSGSADGLRGPFKAQGRVGAPGVGFRLTTGEIQSGKMRLKLAIEPSATTPRAEFDGVATLSGALGFEGQAAAEGVLSPQGREAVAWRAAGALKADTAGATVDPLDVRLGGEERPVALNGRAGFDAAGARLTLAARQLDLDRALGVDGEAASPRQALAAAEALSQTLGGAAGALAAFPATLDLSPGVVTLGGETIPEVRLSLARRPGEAPAVRIEASLPGRTRVVADGRVDPGAAARFRGRIDVAAADARRLRAWLGDLAPPGVSAPFGAISAKAAAEISAVSLSLREAELKLDRTPLKGDVIYFAPVAGERGRLFADLTSEALDIDGAPDMSALIGAAPDHDFSLTLDARAVRVARFGEGALDAGRIRLAVRREGGHAELERLSLERLGGANLTAQGALDSEGGRFTLDLDAERLGDLAALIERLAPGRASAALRARAARLSPARLTVSAEAGPDFALRAAAATGQFAGTRASAQAQAQGGGVAAHLELAQDDVVALLRQIGIDTRGPPRLGPARIVADLSAQPGGLATARALAEAPGAKLSYEGGFLVAGVLAGAPQALGTLSLDAENVAPTLTALGVLAPNGYARGGADLAAAAATTADGLALSEIRGWAFGTRVSGSAQIHVASGDRARPLVEGRLAMERLGLADVAALALGTPPPDAVVKGPWSDRAFAPGLSAEAPDVSARLELGRLDMGPFGESGPARATLALAPGVVRLDELRAPLAGGALTADLAWRRDGLEAGFSGKFAAHGAALDAAPGAARIDAVLDVAGSGRNPAAMVAGLGGEGAAGVSGLILRRAAPGAVAAAIKGADAQTIPLEKGALERALTVRLDAGERRFEGPAEAPLTVATGVLRAGPIALDASEERVSASVSLDLRALSVETRAAIAAKVAPPRWSGAPPSFDMVWRGLLSGAPAREIDAGALLNGLSARSLTLELERVEALDADIAERAAFARRQKAWEFLRRRERELADFEAEQARRAAEARRLEDLRAAEEARREAARRADEARREMQRAIEGAAAEGPIQGRAPAAIQTSPLRAPATQAPLSGEAPLTGEGDLSRLR